MTQPFDWLADVITRQGLWIGGFAVFLGGLALNLTPCVYPMIPVTLAFFSGQSSGKFGRTVLLAFLYVLGLSLNYAILGLVAAKTGSLFGAWLQQPVVLIAIAGIVILLSLSLFGLYDFRLPQALAQRFSRASSGFLGAFMMGMVVGLVAAPCIGPFVLGLLLLVSQLANPAAGFFLFLALGLGMGLPYMVLGIAANQIGRLPKAGAWMLWSKKVLGVMLLGVALYFIKPLLPAVVTRVTAAGLLIGAGIWLGWVSYVEGERSWFRLGRRIVGGLVLAVAVLWIWPRPAAGPLVAWVPYNEAALEQAQRDGKAVLIDIYADWCLPCVEMDHTTFRNPRIVELLSTSVVPLRLDVTREVSPEGERLLQRYDVFGAPTVLLFDRTGKERQDVRVTGFIGSDGLLERLQRLL